MPETTQKPFGPLTEEEQKREYERAKIIMLDILSYIDRPQELATIIQTVAPQPANSGWLNKLTGAFAATKAIFWHPISTVSLGAALTQFGPTGLTSLLRSNLKQLALDPEVLKALFKRNANGENIAEFIRLTLPDRLDTLFAQIIPRYKPDMIDPKTRQKILALLLDPGLNLFNNIINQLQPTGIDALYENNKIRQSTTASAEDKAKANIALINSAVSLLKGDHERPGILKDANFNQLIENLPNWLPIASMLLPENKTIESLSKIPSEELQAIFKSSFTPIQNIVNQLEPTKISEIYKNYQISQLIVTNPEEIEIRKTANKALIKTGFHLLKNAHHDIKTLINENEDFLKTKLEKVLSSSENLQKYIQHSVDILRLAKNKSPQLAKIYGYYTKGHTMRAIGNLLLLGLPTWNILIRLYFAKSETNAHTAAGPKAIAHMAAAASKAGESGELKPAGVSHLSKKAEQLLLGKTPDGEASPPKPENLKPNPL